jgi:uncharacterized protein (DUF1501 family)
MSGHSISNLAGPQHSGLSTIKYLQRTALDAHVCTDKIKQALKKAKNKATYPKNRLVNSLSLTSRLIAGGLPTCVYYASQGGFDTHVRQVNNHNRLMNKLATSLFVFFDNLKQKDMFDCVVAINFSEFGRQVHENANGGTDHGTAAPMFVCGGGVKPGLYGQQPTLDHLDAEDLIHTADFRSVYSTILT